MSKPGKDGQYWYPKRQWLPEWNLASVPEDLLRSEIQKRNNRKRKWHGAGPGRPRSKDLCPCGEMTAARAAKRKHTCEAPL